MTTLGERDERPEGKAADDTPGPVGLPAWRQGYPYDTALGRRDQERTRRAGLEAMRVLLSGLAARVHEDDEDRAGFLLRSGS